MEFNKAALKDRGWSDAMIKRFLDEPDRKSRNWQHPGGADISWYDKVRVLACESLPEFNSAREKAAAKRLISQESARKRKESTMTSINSLSISVPQIEMDRLIELSCISYNSWNQRANGSLATPKSDQAFLDRIAVNFLRHECSDYDNQLDGIRGAVGASDARVALKRRILDAIADAYPELASECAKQQHCAVEYALSD